MKTDSDSGFAEQPLLGFARAEKIATKDVDAKQWRYNHRKRLRERFIAGGHEAMPDYEILELVLFNALLRQDTKPLAHRLMDEFGSFDAVVSASKMRLRKVEGVGERIIQELKIVEATSQRLAKSAIMGKEILSSWDALIKYCTTCMANRNTEQFRILFLDKKNILIADEVQQSGTVDHVPVYPREVAVRCLELNASAIILVHNHPSGDPSPSEADIEMTTRIERALTTLSITLHDHVIIGKNKTSSFHSLGIL